MAFWMRDSASKANKLTDSDLREIADRAASSLEEAFSGIVFQDEETGEEYHYTPDAEKHSHLAALCRGFLRSRFDVSENA